MDTSIYTTWFLFMVSAFGGIGVFVLLYQTLLMHIENFKRDK